MDWLSKLKEVSQQQTSGPPSNSLFCGVAEIMTQEGERVWVATNSEAVKLIPAGAVCFLEDEIKQLQGVGKEAARVAVIVKQAFGNNATVDQTVTTEERRSHVRI